MYIKRRRFGYHSKIRRKRVILTCVVLLAAGSVVTAGIIFLPSFWDNAATDKRTLLQLWDSGSYSEVYEQSKLSLEAHPLDYFLLTLHGFSAYQVGISQISSKNALIYFDDCITSLRKALLLQDSETDDPDIRGRLYYVLGKAYSYKGESYANLCINYLEKAKEMSYNAEDIPEYLGIAYASIGDHRSSVASFIEALEPWKEGENEISGRSNSQNNPSGLLLFSIAKSYIALDDWEMARLYLQHCIAISQDSRLIMPAKLLLAEILIYSGDLDNARNYIQDILTENGEIAEAHFFMGEIYAQQGENARARNEWRTALSIDPAHTKARSRLALQ